MMTIFSANNLPKTLAAAQEDGWLVLGVLSIKTSQAFTGAAAGLACCCVQFQSTHGEARPHEICIQ